MGEILSREVDEICMGCMKMRKYPGRYCPWCGFGEHEHPQGSQYLPYRTILKGRYMTGIVLDAQGFGIVYIALDLSTGRRVAIKEYAPLFLCHREDGYAPAPIAGCEEACNAGAVLFDSRSRFLTRCGSLPGIVDTLDYFTENRTFYLVMEYLDGTPLSGWLPKQKESVCSIDLLRPMMESMEMLHHQNMVHYNIGPDSLIRTEDGRVKLAGFSTGLAFKSVFGEVLPYGARIPSQACYMAPEQHGAGYPRSRAAGVTGVTANTCGAAADVYGAAALCLRCVTGQAPAASWERQNGEKLSFDAVGRITEKQREAVRRGISLEPKERFDTMGGFVSSLWGSGSAPSSGSAPGSGSVSGSGSASGNGRTVSPLGRQERSRI